MRICGWRHGQNAEVDAAKHPHFGQSAGSESMPPVKSIASCQSASACPPQTRCHPLSPSSTRFAGIWPAFRDDYQPSTYMPVYIGYKYMKFVCGLTAISHCLPSSSAAAIIRCIPSPLSSSPPPSSSSSFVLVVHGRRLSVWQC